MPRAKSAPPIACDACGLYDMCRYAGLDRGEQDLDRVVSRRLVVAGGATLVRAGEESHGIWAVRAGAFKTEVFLRDGEVRVLDFHLPGEIIGLESLRDRQHRHTVTALEISSICLLCPWTAPCDGSDVFQRLLVAAMGERLDWLQRTSILTGAQRAEQRIATFLLGLSLRYRVHRLSARAFRLPMTRGDLASYLGLALETVSRVLSRFQNQGLIVMRGRYMEIAQEQALERLAAVPVV